VFGKLVSADEIEHAAQQQYQAVLREAAARKVLASAQDPQLKRLRAIAQRIVPFAASWNDRTQQWKWEVNLIESATAQRLLHARWQDRVLQRHTDRPAAHR